MPQKEQKEASEATTQTPPPVNPMSMFGDMSLLREIIMGPKILEYEQRFSDIEALIEKNNTTTRNHFETLIEKNETATRNRFDALEKEMNSRFDRLEALLKQNIEQMNTQMHNMSKSDKATIADLLVEMSHKLK